MHKILRYYDSFPYTINIAETLKHNQSALDTYIDANCSPGKERNNAVFKNAITYALIHTCTFKNKVDPSIHASTWMNCILKYHLKHERPELTLPHIVFNPLSKPPKRLLMYLAHRELGYLT
jgi:hypothetical protein